MLTWLVFHHGIVNANSSTVPVTAQAGEAATQAGTGTAETKAAPAPSTELPTCDVYNFQIDGNSLQDKESFEKTMYPFLGPGKRIEDMEAARKSMEKLYRDRGYATLVMDIPEQFVKGGRVRLQVVEGRVEYFGITGSRYFLQDKVRAGIQAHTEGQVPQCQPFRNISTISYCLTTFSLQGGH